MSRINKIITLSVLTFLLSFNKTFGQEFKLDPIYFHVFDKDSLAGFDENAARNSAISEQYLGPEFKVRMYHLKRAYINNKYNMWAKPIKDQYSFNAAPKLSVVPGCTNEDFEASTAGSVTTSNQIAGWTVSRGNVQSPNNACNLTGCCLSAPVESELIDAPTGLVDPVIGAIYPIYSVFGTSPGNPNGPLNNPHIQQGMFGNKFIRINSSGLGAQAYSIEKLSKTFSVTANNALFQFAFITVFSSGHAWCSASAVQIKLINATANTVIACPSYTAAGPSGSIPNYTASGVEFLVAQTGASATVNSSLVFNKWNLSSMDLTPFIGQNITIDITVNDCDAGGHYGYMYFDAQCGPMVVYGNGTAYDAGSGNITVPTCGAAGATLCASAGLGPYSWAGPGVNPPFTTPALSNQCYTTNITGTYTLFMSPQGACAPITRILSATVTPAPLLFASVVQAVCGNTTAIVTVTPSGSASVPSTLAWFPTPLTLNAGTTQATYGIPPGPAPTVVTITATDPLGCFVATTASVNPAAPFPTFTINNVTGTSSLTCSNSSITLDILTNYTYGNLSYNWVSANANFSQTPVVVTLPGTYTVTAVDDISGCSATRTIFIGQNTVTPTGTITPLFQSITCANPAVQTITSSATPTLNTQHNIISPYGGTLTANSFTTIYGGAVPPGTYTDVIINLVSGCQLSKTFTVASGGGFPFFSLSSPNNYTLGCGTHSVIAVNINSAQSTDSGGLPIGGVVTCTLLAPNSSSLYTTSVTAIAFNTITVPGTWTAVAIDPTSGCTTKVPFSVIQNTFGPQIEVASLTRTLSCFTPSVQLQGISTTSFTTFSWLTPSGNQTGTLLTVPSTTNVTNTLVATYVLSVTDQNNACISTSLVPIYQNMAPPIVAIAASTKSLTCDKPAITLANNSSTNTAQNFPSSGVVQAIHWEGPPPQVPEDITTTYVAKVQGIYTLTGRDASNGCTATGIYTVIDNKIFPVVNNPIEPAPFFLDCGSSSVAISAIVTDPTSKYTYLWTTSNTSTTSAVTNSVLNVNTVGEYGIEVTNGDNGCRTQAEVRVITGTLTTKFTPDVVSGYAPLVVNFTNNSASSSTSAATNSINTVWNFGNGTNSITPSASVSPVVIYNQPGTYTVTAYANKGACQAAYTKTIVVDIPSKLEIPNVFTPNGDGNNDLFFLRASNLTEITALIYDRWGHKIFELTSNTGNIAWDGKNQVGKDVAEGVYFYIITAKGKDGKDYDTKGNVNLYR